LKSHNTWTSIWVIPFVCRI